MKKRILRLLQAAWLIALLSAMPAVVEAQKVITGNVTSTEDQSSIPGATIREKGTANGTITDLSGNYSITVTSAAPVLIISFVGMETVEVEVGTQTAINVALKTENVGLKEVVVVGYGTVRKSDLTGAVASVNKEQLKQTATMNVAQALQGLVAGVTVTASSGEPGAGMKVRVRGIGTLNNSDPLYVVDGFPTTNLSHISPSDIESMEVLKDASATAIYGSRGANGVIMITTKKGKAGEPTFSFSTYVGIQKPWNLLKVCDAQQYATLVQESYANSNATMDAQTKEMTDYILAHPEYKGTDWQSEVLEASPMIQNYSLSVNGGTEKSRYNIGGTYSSTQGIIKNNNLNKLILTLNHDYKFSRMVETSVGVNYVYSNRYKYSNDMYSGVLPVAVRNSPLIPVWDSNANSWGYDFFSHEMNSAQVADFQQYRRGYENRVVGNAGITFNFTPELSFKSQVGADVGLNKNKDYSPKYFVSNEFQNQHSSLYEDRGSGFSWNWTNYVQYQKTIADNNITAMVGTEASRSQWEGISINTQDIPLDDALQYIQISNTKSTSSANSWQGDERLLSFFGRLNYNYKGKYLVTFNVRRDGSSKFASENQWGTFPSASLAWNVKNESFMNNVNWMSSLKLRAGWGQVGNQSAASSNATIVPVSTGKPYVFGTDQHMAPGVMSDRLGNKDLKWETTSTKGLGVDMGFMGGMFDLSVDYFEKVTTDMILQVPIPVFVGASAPYVNAGDMKNTGIEFVLGHRKQIGEIKYDVSYNMSFIKNKVVSLGGGTPIGSGGAGHLGNTTRTEEGSEIAYFYGYQTDGIFHTQADVDAYKNSKGALIQPNAKPGDVKWIDIDGDGAISDKDQTRLGSWQPKFTYGLNFGASYKGLDFKLSLQGVYGSNIVNALLRYNASTSSPGGIMENWLVSRFEDRWSPANPNNNGARIARSDDNKNYQNFSDLYIEDGSFLRVRNVQIGYTLPSVITSKVALKSVRLYLSADNLFTFTKYKGMEPEVAGGNLSQNVDMATYPQSRILMAGININF